MHSPQNMDKPRKFLFLKLSVRKSCPRLNRRLRPQLFTADFLKYVSEIYTAYFLLVSKQLLENGGFCEVHLGHF